MGMNGVAKRLRLACVFAVLAALAAGIAQAATFEVGPLVMHANGHFSPKALPKRKFAPIDLYGHAEVERREGGVPPALERAVLEFDRDGKLGVSGLAECAAASVANVTPDEARALCRGAIVGEGHVGALIGTIATESLLTVFNGPRLPDGTPTAIIHAQLTAPALQTFAIEVAIERRRGPYGYRAIINVPPIAGGLGAITHVDAKIGRRYVAAGAKRSYVAARCGDSILEARGVFTFADGTTVDGSVPQFCRVR